MTQKRHPIMDPAIITENIAMMAERYPEEARFTSAEERDRHFTPTQRLAWFYRFGTEEDLRQAIIELGL